ncbi:MAG: hypothetical protein U0V70_09435 [Terriglobia bacterium]
MSRQVGRLEPDHGLTIFRFNDTSEVGNFRLVRVAVGKRRAFFDGQGFTSARSAVPAEGCRLILK